MNTARWLRWARVPLVGILLVVTVFLGNALLLSTRQNSVAHAAGTGYLHSSGNQLLSPGGSPVQLKGAMREFEQYYCVQGKGFASGPTDTASVQAMASWGLNVVRIPLNEDCWLGINGANPGGSAYQQDVINMVNTYTAQGFYVVVDEHVNAPGTTLATVQEPMADEDHSSAFWTSVASTFKNNGNVIFDLYNEPHDISWGCWLNGCQTTDQEGAQYQTAGMQELMNTVRNTGAGNFVVVGGLNWASDLSSWLTYKPSDPDNNFGASTHIYDQSPSNDVASVAAQYPVIATEFGSLSGNASWFGVDVPWFTSHGIHFIAWAWDTNAFNTGSNLITDWGGTASSYGQAYKNALAGSSFPSTGVEYAVKVATSGKCLDNDGQTSNGTTIIQWDCAGNANQQWSFTALDNGEDELVNKTSGKCLDNNGQTTNGTSVIQWDCAGNTNQQWSLTNLGNGEYEVVNKTSGKCLDNNGQTTNGTSIIQWDCAGNTNQQWSFA